MNDPTYYNDNKLVRPYRVGVACGACHIAPYPDNPPADPENPRWENLASAIGNQYINEGKVFACNVEKGGFFYEMLAAQPPRHLRHFADRNRSHQQSKRDQCHLSAGRTGAHCRVPEKMAGGTLALPGERRRCRCRTF